MATEDKKQSVEAPNQKKSPYAAPAVVYEETLEFMATTCTPAPPAKGDTVACNVGPIRS